MNDILKYIKNNLISFDQSCNTILNGYPDETLSARAWRTEQENNTFGKFFRPTIDTLFFFQKDHCYNSYLSEIERKQLPKEYKCL